MLAARFDATDLGILAMSEEVSNRFLGERLTVDGDYATWKYVAEAYFIAQGVYEIIAGVGSGAR